MSDANLTTTIVGKLLDWPFLFSVIIVGGAIAFREQISTWMRRVTEVELGKGSLRFEIGKDEVPIEKLDSTITARLRELQEEIESLRGASTLPLNLAAAKTAWIDDEEVPAGLADVLAQVVYPMLESNLWLGRYVQTLATAASVSEDLMLKFCRSRKDIGLFKDSERWVAALSERLKQWG